MNRPSGYDEVQVGEFTPIRLGGHRAVIKQVTEQTSASGKPMIVVLIDFDKADDQAGYFTDQFNKDVRPEKKYPYQAIQYIVSEGSDGKCTKSFKSFMTSFENSNNTKVSWDAKDFTAQFKGKKIGVVYGNVEDEYNGEIKKRPRIRWFCDYSKALDQKVPEDKLIENKPTAQSNTSAATFTDIPDGSSEMLPF